MYNQNNGFSRNLSPHTIQLTGGYDIFPNGKSVTIESVAVDDIGNVLIISPIKNDNKNTDTTKIQEENGEQKIM